MIQNFSNIQLFAGWVLPILFAVTIHEVAHGWVANKLGDKTALIMGRLTLNPLKHIDLLGTIIVPAILLLFGGFIFGWAKPVPISYVNLHHPRRDIALVAVAGPSANLVMAILWGLIAKLGTWMMLGFHLDWAMALVYMGQAGISINIVLMVLNLFPLLPLDGGRILTSLLPRGASIKYSRLEPFGFFILLILLATGVLSYLIGPVVMFLVRLVFIIFNFNSPML